MIPVRLGIVALLCVALGLWFAGAAGRLAVVSIILLFAPGFLLERAFPLRTSHAFVRPAVWLGLSISLVALLYQWATAFNLGLNYPLLAGMAVCCVAAVGIVLWRSQAHVPLWSLVVSHWWLVVVLLATFGVRLYQIRELVLPAWVDSVHHALLIRVAIEHGQAPIDLYPYLPISRLPYHWGYHVVAAASTQLAHVTIPQAMLWQGQALNALHVLTCAALASYLWRKPWAGVVAGIVVGLVSLMPAFYVSWGRYTQLTGLLLLPPLAIVWQKLLTDDRRGTNDDRNAFWRLSVVGCRSSVVVAAVLLAGLNVVHFRVLLFALSLLFAQTMIWLIKQHWQTATRGIVAGAVAGLGGMVLTVPWLLLLIQQRLAPAVEQPQLLASGGSYTALSPGLLWAGENRLLVALALCGGLLGLRLRVHGALMMLLWVALLVVLANPQLALYILPIAAVPIGLSLLQSSRPALALLVLPLFLANPFLLRLPSSWLVTNDVVVISLFVPLSVLIGGFATPILAIVNNANRRMAWRRIVATTSAVGLVAVMAWGGWSQRNVINPTTVLATKADLAALEWAATHTPPDARFLVGAAPWLPTADRGTDGGWWLLPYAGRWTSTPPVIFDYGPSEYVQSVRERTKQIAQWKEGQNQVLEDIITREKIGFVYVREGTGPLTRAAFNSQRYTPVYERDGVVILAVGPRT